MARVDGGHRDDRPWTRVRCSFFVVVPGAVEEAEEEVWVEAIGAGPEAGGVADDGAPPWLAGAGASDDGGAFQAAEDVQEEVG